jgi:hypothetical protein
MALWESDASITFDMFLDFYRDISASYPDDKDFNAMMTKAWRL